MIQCNPAFFLIHYKKAITPLAIGIKNSLIGFGLISIPTFISYFGSDSHKLEKGQEGIITKLSISLMSMNLVSNIGQEYSPMLCGTYGEYCKIASKVAGMAIQTYTFNQTIGSGIAKGISYEIFGFNYKSFMISESVGTISEAAFSTAYKHYSSNKTETNVTKVLNTTLNNLYQDIIVTQHIYSAAVCLYKPIALGENLNPYDMFLYGYLLGDFNIIAAYNTAVNLYEDAKNYLAGDIPQHDEF